MNIRLLNESDYINVLDMVSKIFCKYEPMCKELNITEDDFSRCFLHYIYNCCSCGLSVVIEENNELASICLSIPYKLSEQTVIMDNVTIFKPILNILNRLADSYKIDDNEKIDTLYIFILGTDEKYFRKGYAKILIQYILDNFNYKYYLSDVTNIASQKLLIDKFKFKICHEIKYSEYDEFKNIKDTTGTYRVKLSK